MAYISTLRSFQIETALYISQKDKNRYSTLQVLRSAAGWYFGTIYTDPDTGYHEPGSRDSPYYPTEQAATESLQRLENFYAANIRKVDRYADAIEKWELYMITMGYHRSSEGYRYNP